VAKRRNQKSVGDAAEVEERGRPARFIDMENMGQHSNPSKMIL